MKLDGGQLSAILGWISMGCWIVMYCPQIIENYRLQSGDGLSLLLLMAWMISDICNLSGVILGDLAPSATRLGAYLLLSDFFLLVQVYYYRWKRSRYPIGPLYDIPTPETSTTPFTSTGPGSERHVHECEYDYDYDHWIDDSDTERTPILGSRRRRGNGIGDSEKQDTLLRVIVRSVSLLVAVSIAGVVAWWVDESYFSGGGANGDIAEGTGMRRVTETLIRIIPEADIGFEEGTWKNLEWLKKLVARAFGCTNVSLYIFGNLSQISKNFQTRCEGLSPSLYVLMVFGGCTHILSIITKCLKKDHLVKNMGRLAGYGISSLLASMVIGQILYYRYTERGRRGAHTTLL